jgi:hypothetical protein
LSTNLPGMDKILFDQLNYPILNVAFGFFLTEAFAWGCFMCRERKIYSTSSDPYCNLIKRHFNEKGFDYQDVDISRCFHHRDLFSLSDSEVPIIL